MRRGLICLFAFGLLPSCDEDDEESSQVACVYDYSVYSVSEYGSSFDEYSDECVTLSSAEACDSYTESSTECFGGYCSDYSYTNVRVIEGTCEDYMPSGGSCEWTNDGECDEPEGTGLCPEGSDVADC